MWATRKQKGKKAQMASQSDRPVARLIAEAMGTVKVVFDRDKNIGVLPANLKKLYGPDGTVRCSATRGVREHALQITARASSR